MLIISGEPALMERLIGSETASAPIGIARSWLPSKERVFIDPSCDALVPTSGLAGILTVTLVMASSFFPNTLDRRMRIFFAPRETWRVCRIVVFLNTESEPCFVENCQ